LGTDPKAIAPSHGEDYLQVNWQQGGDIRDVGWEYSGKNSGVLLIIKQIIRIALREIKLIANHERSDKMKVTLLIINILLHPTFVAYAQRSYEFAKKLN